MFVLVTAKSNQSQFIFFSFVTSQFTKHMRKYNFSREITGLRRCAVKGQREFRDERKTFDVKLHKVSSTFENSYLPKYNNSKCTVMLNIYFQCKNRLDRETLLFELCWRRRHLAINTKQNIREINCVMNVAYQCEHSHSCKGESIPLHAWSGPEGSRKLRFPDYVTMAQNGGKVTSITDRPFYPQETLLVLISVRG